VELPAVRETLERLLHFNGELARMIDVYAHPQGMVFGEDRAKLRDVMRCGRKIGTRVPTRRNSMCLIARRRASNLSSLSSLKIRASPPLRRTSRTSVVLFKIVECLLEIGVQFLFADAADDPAPGWQYRQYAAQRSVTKKRTRSG